MWVISGLVESYLWLFVFSLPLEIIATCSCIFFSHKFRFHPETVNWMLMKGLVGWVFQVILLKVSLMSLSSGETPLLDIIAYAGYAFTGISLALFGKLLWRHSYYILLLSSCLCMGMFLVKTMKRVLYAEVRSYDSGKHHVLLLLIALAQFPLYLWLGNITVNWLF